MIQETQQFGQHFGIGSLAGILFAQKINNKRIIFDVVFQFFDLLPGLVIKIVVALLGIGEIELPVLALHFGFKNWKIHVLSVKLKAQSAK